MGQVWCLTGQVGLRCLSGLRVVPNGPLRNCCKVPDKYLIGHVQGGQNGRSTLSLFVCSFDFSSLGPHPRFSLCLFLVPLVSHHWDAILGLI